ncbi:MAG: hypothetical protein ACP5U2_08475 [Bryobacteraceae bacterium]
MQLSEVFRTLGETGLAELLRHVSIGPLRAYQLYESLKVRAHVRKLNTQTLRKSAPRFWARLVGGDEDLARDLAQGVLVSNLGMVQAVLDFLGVPHRDGFFEKDVDASPYLSEGWQQRVWERFRGQYPDTLLLFYINHLGWELGKAEEVFAPAAA